MPYAPYAGDPQYPYQHIQNTGFPEHGQPGSSHPPHYNNAYSFSTNRQGISTPTATKTVVKPPLGPGFGQSSNSAGQLPSSLAVPTLQQPAISHSLPPLQHVKNKDSSSAQVGSQRSGLPLSSNSLPEPPLSPAVLVRDAPMAAASGASDLEEGELSDRNIAARTKPTSSSMALPPLSPSRPDEHKNGGRETGRDVARKALRELEENRISFLDVAAEIVDDELTAASLQRLYHEIGIWISPSQLAAASVNDTRPRKQRSGKKTESGELNALPEKLCNTAPDSVPKKSSKNVSAVNGSVFEPTAQVDVVTESVNPTISDSRTTAPTAPVAASSNEVLTSTIGLGKANAAKSNEKAFDRKGYIARMLAAKASKTTPVVDRNDVINLPPQHDASTGPSSLQLNGTSMAPGTQQEIALANNDPQKAQDEVVLPRQVQSTGGNVGMGSQKKEATENAPIKPVNQADAQAKKRAQTELARQKMEALRSRDNEQRKDQAERHNNFTAVESLPPPEFMPALRLSSEKSAVPASTKAPSTASSQSSFFSPVSGKSLFNLPGLFMSSGPSASLPAIPQPSQSSLPSTSQTFPISQPKAIAAFAEPSPSAGFSSQLLASSTPPMKTTKTIEMASVSSPSTEIVNTSRKRQKASDFIEPPTTRLKRHLGLSGDKGVVIEVSEDEAFDDAVDHDVDTDVDMDADTDQDLYGNINSKSIGIPSLQQKGSSKLDRRGSVFTRQCQGSALATPPLPSTPGKGTELDGLRWKEKEIELMNRKIVELEQRRKAKQSYSRAHTPSITGVRSSPPKAGKDVPDVDEQSQTILVADAPLAARKQQTDQEVPNVGAAEAHNAQEEERLLLVDQISVLEEQREKTVEMQRLLDAEEHRLNEVETAGGEGLGTQRIAIEQQQVRELEERQSQKSEAERAKRLEAQRINELERQRSSEIKLATHDAEQQRSSEIAIEAGRQQKQERRAAIEVGLPILDAEVEKTEQKLQHLRRQIQELETELKRGIKGRRDLVEELNYLQTPLSGSPGRTTSDILDIEEDESSSKGSAGKFIPHNVGLYGPQAPNTALQALGGFSPVCVIADAHISVDSPKVVPNKLASDASASSPPRNGVPPSEGLRQTEEETSASTNGQPSDGELPEDTMDISRSDIDEGEITEYSPESLVMQQTEADHEDVYEPHPIPGTKSALPSEVSTRQETSQLPMLAAQDASATQGDDTVQVPQESEAASNLTMEAGSAGRISTPPPSHSPPPNIIDDSDDYEPPEPVSPVDIVSRATSKDIVDPKFTKSVARSDEPAYSTDQRQPTDSNFRGPLEIMAQAADLQSKQTVRFLLLGCPGTDGVSRRNHSSTNDPTTSFHMKAHSNISSRTVTILPTLST